MQYLHRLTFTCTAFLRVFSLFASPFAASYRRYMRSNVSFMTVPLPHTDTAILSNVLRKQQATKKQQQQLCSAVFFIAFLSAVIIWHLPKHINKPLEPLHTFWLFNWALCFRCILLSCAAVVSVCWPIPFDSIGATILLLYTLKQIHVNRSVKSLEKAWTKSCSLEVDFTIDYKLRFAHEFILPHFEAIVSARLKKQFNIVFPTRANRIGKSCCFHYKW